jgi:Ig-like domain CHU_C associated/Secretion system C-terminal sorting domain
MKKFSLFLILVLVTLLFTNGSKSHAQVIGTPVVTDLTNSIPALGYCPGASVNVTFTYSGFTGTPTFTVQLSDALGFFSTPVALGTTTSSPFVGAIPTSTTTGSGYRIRILQGATSSSSSPFQMAAIPTSGPLTTTPVSFCQGVPATPLTATATVGNTVRWYTTATGGTALMSAPTPSTTTAVPQEYYVTQAANVVGCEYLPRTKVTANIIAAPTAAPATTTQLYYCINSTATALTATPDAGFSVKWYATATSTTPLTQPVTPTTTTIGTVQYYVTQGVGSCEYPTRTVVNVTTLAAPTVAPTIPATVLNYCQGSVATPLSATATNAGYTIRWYNAGSVQQPSAPTPSTTASSQYFVTQGVGTCEYLPRTAITVNITNAPAAAPTTTTAITQCQGQTAAPLTATPTAGNNIFWYDAAGNALSAAPIPSTTSLTPQTFFVTQGVGSCLYTPRTRIDITTVAAPTAAPTVPITSLNLCQGQPVPALTATAASGYGIRWYTTTTGGTFSTTAPVATSGAVGIQRYYVTQGINNCEFLPRTEIVVTIYNTALTAPVVTTPVLYCLAQTSSPLSASAMAGQSINWYTAATGGAASATPPSPNTAVAGSTTYYVSQGAGVCESPRSAIAVNVVSTPPTTGPTVAINPVEFCINQTALPIVATATSTHPIVWYSTPTSTTPLAGAPTPITTAIGTTKYYVTQGVGNCEFIPRLEVTVNVSGAPVGTGPTIATPALVFCQGQTGLTALVATASGNTPMVWYSTATGGTGSSVAPTPSSTNVGTTNYYVTQGIGVCEILPRKVATVKIVAPPAVAPVTPTAPIAYCQNQAATPLTATATDPDYAVRWYTAATGGTASSVAPTPVTTAIGTQTFYVTQGIGSCEFTPRKTITVATNASSAAAPMTTTAVGLCQNATATPLVATPNTTGSSIAWYSSATSTTALASPPTPTTAVSATTNSIFYASEISASGCESPRIAVNVTVYVTPAPTVVGTLPIQGCQNTTAPALDGYVNTANTGNSLVWYGTNATGGSPSSVAPIAQSAGLGLYSYYVVQKNLTTNCESNPRTVITVNTNTLPAAPTVVSPQNFCQNTTATLVSPAGNLRWYTASTGGTAGSAAPSVTSISPTAAPNNYYVSQIVGTCESTRAVIFSSIIATPTNPTYTPPSLCNYSPSTTLTAIASSGNSLRWYSNSVLLSGPPTVTPSAYGSNTSLNYQVSQVTTVGGTSCEGAKIPADAFVFVATAPTATPAIYCNNAPTAQLSATPAAGGTLQWYTTSAGGTATTVAPTPSSATVGVTTYYVSQVMYVAGGFAGCESPRTPVAITTNALPPLPVVTTPVVYCQNERPNQAAATVATGSYLNWYPTATGGTSAGLAPTPSTSVPATFNYYVSQTNGVGCEGARATILVTVNPRPAPATGPSPVYCQNEAAVALIGSGSAGNALKWYDDNTTGVPALPAAPVHPTVNVGKTYYYLTQTNNFGCESEPFTITAIVNPRPGQPTVRTPDIYCQNGTAQPLQAQGDAGNQLKWYDAAYKVLPSIPTISTANPQAISYNVSQVNAFNCESSVVPIAITVKPLPPAPVAKNAYSYCQFDAAVPIDAAGTQLKWYQPDGSNTNVAPVPPTSSGYNLNWFVTATFDGCEGPRTTINVEVKTTPIPTYSSPYTLCQNEPNAKPLQATGTNLKWYGTATGGTSSSSSPTPFTQSPGTYFAYVTQTGTNGCESPRGEFLYIIQPLPSATISGSASIAQGQSATLKIDFLGQGPWTYTLSNGFTATTTQNPVTITVTPLSTEVFTLTKVANVCGDGIPAGAVTVNVRSTSITIGTPNLSTICAGERVQLPFFTSEGLPTNIEYKVQFSKTMDENDFQTAVTTGITSPLTATIPATSKAGNYYMRVLGVTPSGNIKGVVGPVQITVRELPSATISGPIGLVYDNTNHKIIISLTGESPWSFVYRDSLAREDKSVSVAVSPYEISSPPKTNTYSMVSISNACGTTNPTSKYRLQVYPLLSVPTNSEWLKVYPVPTKTELFIEIENGYNKPATIRILDTRGRILTEQKIKNNRSTIDMGSMALGTYILQAEQNGKTVTRKILKVE